MKKTFKRKYRSCILLIGSCIACSVYADQQFSRLDLITENAKSFFTPKSDIDFNKVNFTHLSNLNSQEFNTTILPIIGEEGLKNTNSLLPHSMTLHDAVKIAIQRHPKISEAMANLSSKNAQIDVARANYYPQLSGGLGTGNFTSGERGRQVLELNATQMFYDFGKVRSAVDVQRAGLIAEQAELLVTIDDVANQVALAMINIIRYQELSQLAQQQIQGLKYVAEIATLRANAGISSQADPIQAQSFIELAESTLIEQQTQLSQYKQNLNTLLGFDAGKVNWLIPTNLIEKSGIYTDPKFTDIPNIIAAQADIELTKAQKKQTDLSRYPTINVVGSVSQALNGVNPNNNKDDGLYSSIMLQANSNFYQGGAIAAQSRAASYAEEAARSRLQNAYLTVQDQIKLTQDQIHHKQRQISILTARQSTTVQTKELYQEQYKLGTRSVLDLLNAEQSIHTANMSLVSARYDIYSNLVQYITATGRTRTVYDLNNMSIQGLEIQQ